jgi:hypothetical protein
MHDTTVYTLSGVCRETLASEMLANRWAVQVLQVWGDSERQAVQATVLHLLALQRLRGDQQAVGHSYCAEAADLPRHYPYQPDPRPRRPHVQRRAGRTATRGGRRASVGSPSPQPSSRSR